MKEPAYVAATLRWCNRQRVKNGKKPLKKMPKGKPFDPESCPCGKATGLSVGTMTFSRNGKQLGTLPKSVSRFVFAFDDRELPQYIDHGPQ